MSSPFNTSRISLQFRDLKTHHIPRLSTLKSNQLLQEYEAEINQLLEDLRLNIQELELEIQDLEGGKQQKRNATLQVDGLKNDWQRARGATRNALLNARRSIKTAMEQEARSELNLDNVSGIIGKRSNASRTRGDGGDDNIHTASQDVTTALERTLTLLSQELEKSTFSSQLLDESSQSLTSISLEYTSFSSLVKSSTHLIKTMERADFYDRLMVFTSFAFFLLCVMYILKRRIWDNGISILSFVFSLLTFWRKKNAGGSFVGGEKLIKGTKDLLQDKELGLGRVEKVVESLITTSIASIASRVSGDHNVDPTTSTRNLVDESQDGNREREALGIDLGTGPLSRLNSRPTERVEL